MERIIFEYEGGVAVMSPNPECGLTTLQVGQKDVPAGVSFWIVDESALPADTPADAWEIDLSTAGEPSGTGGTFIPARQEDAV